MKKRTRNFLTSIIFVFSALSACLPAAPADDPTPSPVPATATALFQPTPTPPPSPSPTPTAAATATATASPTPFPYTWAGQWNVWIANPNISIVKTVEFFVEGDVVRTDWYEGTRHVVVEGQLSPDGSRITGTLWNSDVEALPILLVLAPDASFFTGTADSEAGLGQFCGTRTDPQRPNPCRGAQD